MAGESLLLQALSKGKNDYLSQDPLFRAGALVGQAQLAPAQNNLQAVLLPLLQGGISGTMQHYGQKNALAESLKDTSNIYKQITGKDYVAPEDYSFQSGQGAIFQALQDQQNKQKLDELAAKNAFTKENTLLRNNMVQNPDGSVSLAPGAEKVIQTTEGIKAEAKAKAKGSASKQSIPPASLDRFARTKSFIDEADRFAGELDNVGDSWAGLQKSKAFSAFDEKGIAIQISNLADKLSRARTGAALNQSEEILYKKIVGGDISAGPKRVAALLKKLTAQERRMAQSEVDVFKTMSEGGFNGLRSSFDAPSEVETRTLGNGEVVKVKKQPDGSYIEVP